MDHIAEQSLTYRKVPRRIVDRRMSVSARQIEFLARAIVNRLEDRSMAEFSDAESGIAIVSRVLLTNLRQSDQLHQDAWERLSAAGQEPEPTAVEEEMRRLAEERGVVL